MTLTQTPETLRSLNSYSFQDPINSSIKPQRKIKRVRDLSKQRGVRMRSWGKWVSEIREPGKKSRIWLGTYSTADMAARAHDVAALSMKGDSAFLNFPKLANLLPRPVSLTPHDVQAAAAKGAYMHHLDSQQVLSSLSSGSRFSSIVSDIDLTSEYDKLREFVDLPSLEESFMSSRMSSSFAFVDSVDCWTYPPSGLQSNDEATVPEMGSFEGLLWNFH